MAAVQTLSTKTTSPDALLATLERDGCIVLTDLMSDRSLQALASDLDSHFTRTPMCQGNFFGFATKRMSGILAKSVIAPSLAVDQTILSVMDHFLLPACSQYQLNLTQAIQIGPGEPAQYVHTDDLMFPFEMPMPGQQKMINCMWAIDPFTIENGATLVVPGSHLWPRDRRPEANEIVAGEMRPGSVLIYFGSLLHAGGCNRTTRSRTGLVMSYCLGWLRQAENHYLALPRELAASFPERLKQLLGYFVHKPNLGAVNGRDPIELLSEELSGRRFEEFLPPEVQNMLGEFRKQAA